MDISLRRGTVNKYCMASLYAWIIAVADCVTSFLFRETPSTHYIVNILSGSLPGSSSISCNES